jgi:hypothetical protein
MLLPYPVEMALRRTAVLTAMHVDERMRVLRNPMRLAAEAQKKQVTMNTRFGRLTRRAKLSLSQS